MNFGERVRLLRLQRSMTQSALAKRLGVSMSYISKVERGRLHFGDYPSEKFIHKLTNELNANEDELLMLADKVPTKLRSQILRQPDLFKGTVPPIFHLTRAGQVGRLRDQGVLARPRPTRPEQFHSAEIGIVHTVQRCVRRAFLAGVDDKTGKDFSFRREWIRRRMESLASVFGIDVLTYAIMVK